MLSNFTILIFSALSLHADTLPPFTFSEELAVLNQFKSMLVNVREKKISPEEAKEVFVEVVSSLRIAFPKNKNEPSPLVFPLVGSKISAVGGNGRGFYVHRFDLFDQNVSGSHPAHDIFIYDPDHDCIDNRRNTYVDIASVSNGIVLAVEKNWTDTSAYRGGNYVWIYDFERGGLWYYAHHREVFVETGQFVAAGDKIGEVGRSGASAQAHRSDTHLHLMYLAIDDEDLSPKPFNYYPWLRESEFISKSTTPTKQRKRINAEFIKPKPAQILKTNIKPPKIK